jgi:lipid-A-disaccharide synthase
VAHFLRRRPDVFIGIDSPDFNLPVERRLRAAGIRTLHYVSPSVWAWRPGRVRNVARAAERVLTLLPFEEAFYARHGFAATFVGHPLADAIPMRVDRQAARRALALDADTRTIAVLPGSRHTEIKRLGPAFIETACWLAARRDGLKFVVPATSPALRQVLEGLWSESAAGLDVTFTDGSARTAMAAADAVLAASGTATLEALLLKRPMVVAYRVAPLSAFVARRLRLMQIERFTLPNLLAGRELVEEFMQERARADLLGPAVLRLLDDPAHCRALAAEFARLHNALRCNADERAARAVAEVLGCQAASQD